MFDSKREGGTTVTQYQKEDKLLQLAQGVGDFIHYWGFRKIHGQIWTLVYLSEKPINPTFLATRLNVSKALISSALGDLEKYELLIRVKNENRKEKLYTANTDVFEVIKNVLRDRELEMISGVLESALALSSSKMNSVGEGYPLKKDRLEDIAAWTQMAKFFLGTISNAKDIDDIPISPS